MYRISKDKLRAVLGETKRVIEKNWATGDWVRLPKGASGAEKLALEAATKAAYDDAATSDLGIDHEFVRAYEFGKRAGANAKCEVCLEGGIAVAAGRQGLSLKEAVGARDRLAEYVTTLDRNDYDPDEDLWCGPKWDDIPDLNDSQVNVDPILNIVEDFERKL